MYDPSERLTRNCDRGAKLARIKVNTAFTMVELLVTVGIIATLAALAMPVMKGMVDRGKETTCISNLRNLGQAYLAYANDNNGLLLATTNNDPTIASGSSWQVMIISYLGMKFPSVNQKSILLCPAAMDTYPGGKARRTYAQNWQNVPTSASGSLGKAQKTRMSQHSKPTQTILLLESKGAVGGAGDGASAFELATYAQCADWRHGKALNTLCLDGHVEKFSQTDTERIQTYINNFCR